MLLLPHLDMLLLMFCCCCCRHCLNFYATAVTASPLVLLPLLPCRKQAVLPSFLRDYGSLLEQDAALSYDYLCTLQPQLRTLQPHQPVVVMDSAEDFNYGQRRQPAPVLGDAQGGVPLAVAEDVLQQPPLPLARRLLEFCCDQGGGEVLGF